jgi:SAM-dependent methyltransferase
MNHLRINTWGIGPDNHRPPESFWGPIGIGAGTGQVDINTERDLSQPEPTKCHICSYPNTSFLINVYGWPVHECLCCGVGFVWPQPSDELLQGFYSSTYWADYLGSDEPLYFRPELTSHIFIRQAQCFDRIMQGRRDARVLDVGAGDGTMLRLLADMGYPNIYGIDLDESNAQRARHRLGVNVDAGDFLSLNESGWDAITLWAVVEHLKDPVSYLRHARELLKPQGIFILMTGDNSSAQAWIQGTLDMWVYPPEHLFYFTRKSLRFLFREAGYSNFKCRLQFQPWWKESILWGNRMLEAVKARVNPSAKSWRSVNSNLLVAWGKSCR